MCTAIALTCACAAARQPCVAVSGPPNETPQQLMQGCVADNLRKEMTEGERSWSKNQFYPCDISKRTCAILVAKGGKSEFFLLDSLTNWNPSCPWLYKEGLIVTLLKVMSLKRQPILFSALKRLHLLMPFHQICM